jgi:ribose-phosphate pyrophosphokinase
VLVIPYFGYSTMERATRPGEVVTAKTIARQLSAVPRATRGNWVLLTDLHSAGIVHYFEGDTVALELYAQEKLVAAIERLRLPKLCLASTDMGRAKWVEAFANRLHAPVALIHKKRLSGSQTRISAVVGDVTGRDVVIFDDMIRSGGSLIQAAEAYLLAGAASVQAAATHLVLPPGTAERLESAPLARIIGTDTHPNHQRVLGRACFEVVSVAELFADVVRRLVA